MSLLTYPYRGSAVVTTASWNALDAQPSWWDSFARVGQVSGTASPAAADKSHPAGVVAVQFVLKPRESIDVPMCISWFTPVMLTGSGEDYGHYYQEVFPDSAQAARSLLGDWQALLALTEEWQKRISGSSMPAELDKRLINSVSTLVTNSVFVRDGRFTLLPDPEPIDVAASHESYLFQRRSAADLLLALYPQLDAQEMVNLLAARVREGKFPSDPQDWAGRIGPLSDSAESADASEGNPIDLPGINPPGKDVVVSLDAAALADSSSYMIQADRFVTATNDLDFLRHAVQNIRSVVMAFQTPDGITRLERSGGARAANGPPESALIDWLALLQSARRLAQTAQLHAFEWAVPAGPLGSSPGGLLEIATEQHFVDICDAETDKAQTELLKRGVSLPSASRCISCSGHWCKGELWRIEPGCRLGSTG